LWAGDTERVHQIDLGTVSTDFRQCRNTSGSTVSTGKDCTIGHLHHPSFPRFVNIACVVEPGYGIANTIRYDTIAEFNVDSKAEYTA